MSESVTRVEASPSAPRVAWRLSRDEQLAKRAAAGDKRAFEALFTRYHQELYRYSRAILTTSEDAEDAIQATMVKALRALPGERREIAIKPWLYRVAHNESISILRRRRETVELDPGAYEAPATVEATAEMRERIRTMTADLATLPERQRSTLVMRELNDLSYDEIGASLAISAAAARQSVYEARMSLLEVAEGREMECTKAREAISAGDRRVLRGRRLRAHLRGCDRCQDFEAAIDERRTTLAALAAPLAAPAASALLHGALAGGSTGAAAAGTTIGAGIAGGAALKGAFAVLTIAAVGGGAAATGVLGRDGGDRAANAEPTATPATSPASGAAGDVGAGAPAPDGAAGGDARVRDGTGRDGTRAHEGNAAAEHHGSGHGASNSAAAPGQTDAAPGQSVSAEGPAHANAGGGGSTAAPGQTGTAPGQAHSNAGGGGAATAPGQTATAPSNGAAASGQAGDTPAAESPSPNGNAVGQATAPGQADE